LQNTGLQDYRIVAGLAGCRIAGLKQDWQDARLQDSLPSRTCFGISEDS